MTMGDLVMVTFGRGETAELGIFIRDDTSAIGEDENGDLIITRAFVLWGGEVYSTPLDQMELISEVR